jgi:citrate lyase gamma subunit
VKIKQEELAGSLSNTEKMMSTMADTSPIRTTLESS